MAHSITSQNDSLKKAQAQLLDDAEQDAAKSIKTAKMFKKKAIDGRNMADVERVAPIASVDDWLQNLWDLSCTKKELQSKSGAKNLLVKVWKLTCAFMSCSPCAIVSPRYGLHYVPNSEHEPDNDDSDSEDNPDMLRFKMSGLWSQPFCNELSTLICQPLWEGDASMLATAIQYAVICRTNNRGPWKLALNARNVPEFELLRQKAESGFHESAYEYITQQCNEAVARGDKVRTELAFLSHLGGFIKDRKRRSIRNSQLWDTLSRDIYSVTVVDLQNILEALDTFNPHGGPLHTTHTIEKIERCRVSNKSFPPASAVEDLHPRAFLNEWSVFFREKTQVQEGDASRKRLVVQPRSSRSGQSKSYIADSDEGRPQTSSQVGRHRRRRLPKRTRRQRIAISESSEGEYSTHGSTEENTEELGSTSRRSIGGDDQRHSDIGHDNAPASDEDMREPNEDNPLPSSKSPTPDANCQLAAEAEVSHGPLKPTNTQSSSAPPATAGSRASQPPVSSKEFEQRNAAILKEIKVPYKKALKRRARR